ncbi:MAG TPA: hypothetical protein VF760_00260 [Xanthobacteraceae bacterium]
MDNVEKFLPTAPPCPLPSNCCQIDAPQRNVATGSNTPRKWREMWTDTYAFQAKSFYEKLGFTVFGRLDGPAPIFPRFFLKKALSVVDGPLPAAAFMMRRTTTPSASTS